jgi:hypothetical protein
MHALQRKLTAKTREIEALIAAEQKLGNLDAIDSADYARLQAYVENLIYQWQEAKVGSDGNAKTPINRIIAEREEIEDQIVALQVR